MNISLTDLIQKQCITIERDATCSMLVDTLLHAHASQALVVHDGAVVGVVTTQDIMAHYLQSHDCMQEPIDRLIISAPLLIPVTTDLPTAYMLFRQYDVRHIVVTDDEERPLGLIDELSLLAHLPSEVLLQTRSVASLMQRQPLTLEEQMNIHDAFAAIYAHGGDAAVILSNGEPVGILTEFDLLDEIERKIPPNQPVGTVMSTPLISVDASLCIQDAAEQMREHRVRHLVVLEKGRLAGLLGEHDLLRFAASPQAALVHDTIEHTPHLLRLHKSGVDEGVLIEHVLNRTPGIIFVLDPDTDRIRYINPGVQAVLGLTPDEIRGTEGAVRQMVHPDDRQRFADAIAALQEPGQNATVDFRIFDSRGETHTLRCHLGRYSQERGTHLIVGIASDISELRQLRTSAETATNTLTEVFRHIPDIYYRTDDDGTIVMISDAVEPILGYRPEEVIGQKVERFYTHPEEQEHTLEKLRTQPDGIKVRAPLRHKDGHAVWVEAHVRIHNGRTGVEGIIHDISRERKLLSKLEEREQRYRTIFEHSPAGIVYADEHGIVRDCNAAALDVFGATREQFCGVYLPHRLTNENLLRAVHNVLQGQTSSFNGPYRSILSGKESYLDVRMRPLFDRQGKQTGSMGLLIDRYEEKQAEQEREHYLQIAPVIIVALDRDGTITKINDKGAALLQQTSDALLGKNWFDVAIPPNERETVREVFETIMRGEANYPDYFENAIMTPKGERLIAWHNLLLRDSDGKPAGTLSAGEDITQKRREEERLYLLGAMYEAAREGVVICDADTQIIDVNPAFSAITGYSREEVLGKTPALLASGRHDRSFYAQMWESLQHTGTWQGEIVNRTRQGELYPEWLSITALRDTHGNVTHYMGLFSDISQLKRSEEQMRYLALHDALTDLPNRHLLHERIEQAIRHARREGKQLAVLFIDLDDFKHINDLYGHDVGDRILQETAKRLRRTLREDDTLARFGGDEFIALVSNIASAANTALIAEKIIAAMREPFELDGTLHYLGASVGIAIYPADAQDSTGLISAADTAMYRAKNSGKNRFAYYTKALSERLQHRVDMNKLLLEAIDQKQFVVHFQPQLLTKTGSIDGLEALVRWRRDDGSLIPPMQFIPLLEANHKIIDVSRQIFHMAFGKVNRWVDSGLFDGRVAVNVSGVHLEYGDPVADIREAFEATGLHPKHIEVEVTESVLMHQASKWQSALHEFRRMGISIAIDDFGTGYSSLAYLSRFPLSVLKIDKSFVDGLPGDPTSGAIAHSVIALAKSLNVYTLAEGVETPEQAKWLKREECDVLQGYLYAPPMSAADTERWLRDHTS